MAGMEGVSFGARGVGWRRVGRAALGVALVIPLMACEETIGLEGLGSSKGSNAPDYSLSVNCTVNPGDSQELRIVQTREVQTVGLEVDGQGYQDRWRLQVLSAGSDLTVSRPDGSSPLYAIGSQQLETGRQQVVRLPHGVLSVQQGPGAATQAPQAQAPEVRPSASQTPAVGPQLDIALSCF